MGSIPNAWHSIDLKRFELHTEKQKGKPPNQKCLFIKLNLLLFVDANLTLSLNADSIYLKKKILTI